MGSGDLFWAGLEQIINMKHELVRLAGKINWVWIDDEIASLYSDRGGLDCLNRISTSISGASAGG